MVMYSRVGGGHLSAARALAAELEAAAMCTARLVDIYVDCGRFPVTRFSLCFSDNMWPMPMPGLEIAPWPSSYCNKSSICRVDQLPGIYS